MTPHFVLLHVPKTGGTFLSKLCRERLEVLTETTAHSQWAELPNEFRELPAFVLVRNPWDWYVSWWSYNRAQGTLDGMGFEETLRGLYASHPVYQRFGYFGAMFSGIVKDAPETVGRFETLRTDFLTFLDERGIPTSKDFTQELLTREPENVSDREPYAAYYDAATRALVAEKDASIVKRFGYTF